jgi:hypothetical protein
MDQPLKRLRGWKNNKTERVEGHTANKTSRLFAKDWFPNRSVILND